MRLNPLCDRTCSSQQVFQSVSSYQHLGNVQKGTNREQKHGLPLGPRIAIIWPASRRPETLSRTTL